MLTAVTYLTQLVTKSYLSQKIKLQAPRKLQDSYIGPFKVLERIGEMVYRLDLSANKLQALRGLHNIFHVSLLRHYRTNRLSYKVPPVEIDGKEQYEVKAIQKYRVVCGKM